RGARRHRAPQLRGRARGHGAPRGRRGRPGRRVRRARGRGSREVRDELERPVGHGGGQARGGSVTVTVGLPSDPLHDKALARLVGDRVASRITARDAGLWGPEAEAEAAIRLGWVDLPRTSRPLLAEIDALRADL